MNFTQFFGYLLSAVVMLTITVLLLKKTRSIPIIKKVFSIYYGVAAGIIILGVYTVSPFLVVLVFLIVLLMFLVTPLD